MEVDFSWFCTKEIDPKEKQKCNTLAEVARNQNKTKQKKVVEEKGVSINHSGGSLNSDLEMETKQVAITFHTFSNSSCLGNWSKKKREKRKGTSQETENGEKRLSVQGTQAVSKTEG